VPVHGLLVDIENGRLEWLVNGYHNLGQSAVPSATPGFPGAGTALPDFKMEDLPWPETKIGEVSNWTFSQPSGQVEHVPPSPPEPPVIPPSKARPTRPSQAPPPLRVRKPGRE
jgi:hypothetical protein